MQTVKASQKKNRAKLLVADSHPDHAPEMLRLKRIKGQVEGVEKMILDRRYCPDIITQIRAAKAALGALEGSILKTHLRHCVKDVLKTKDAFNAEAKIQEIIELLGK
jgi:DNA-binding FrmR family transcriptional regulator